MARTYESLVHPVYRCGSPVLGAKGYVVHEYAVYEGTVTRRGNEEFVLRFVTSRNSFDYAPRWFGDPAEARIELLDRLREEVQWRRDALARVEQRLAEVEAGHG